MFCSFDYVERLNGWRSRVLGGLLALLFCLAPLGPYEFDIGADVFEYISMTNAFRNHGTPDIQLQDEPAGGQRPQYGLYASARTGSVYCWHFWLYSLCAAPLVSLPHPWGGDVPTAFATLNRLLFALAIWAVAFTAAIPRMQRLLWIALSASSVVIMYLRWVGPELFSWAFVMLALSFLAKRQYIGASACASLAAMQNPPLLFIACCCAVLSLRSQSPRVIVLAFLAAVCALLPPLFYFLHFGSPSLIVLHQQASWRYATTGRLFSLFFDLNFGIFFYLPVLLILWGRTFSKFGQKGHRTILALNLSLIPVIVTSLFTVQWSAANLGVFRYAVWMIPILAYAVSCMCHNKTRLRYGILVALVTQLTLLNDLPSWLGWRGIARVTLENAPQLYSPEPEIFVDHVLRQDTLANEWEQHLPVAFFDSQHNATKILATSRSLALLSQRFQVDPAYKKYIFSQYRTQQGWFYLHPPQGAVQIRNEES